MSRPNLDSRTSPWRPSPLASPPNPRAHNLCANAQKCTNLPNPPHARRNYEAKPNSRNSVPARARLARPKRCTKMHTPPGSSYRTRIAERSQFPKPSPPRGARRPSRTLHKNAQVCTAVDTGRTEAVHKNAQICRTLSRAKGLRSEAALLCRLQSPKSVLS